MSTTLENAINQLRKLPEDRQDQFARLVLHEIEEDERWMRSTASLADKLRGLVNRICNDDDLAPISYIQPISQDNKDIQGTLISTNLR